MIRCPFFPNAKRYGLSLSRCYLPEIKGRKEQRRIKGAAIHGTDWLNKPTFQAAPDPFITAGIVFIRIFISNTIDQLSMYSMSSFIQ